MSRSPTTIRSGRVSRRSQTRTRAKQLGQTERLGDVVVRARVETDDDIDLVAARRQHQNV